MDFSKQDFIRVYEEKLIEIFRREFDERLKIIVASEVKSQLQLVLKDMSRLSGKE